jgi:hypothetical protein
MLKDVEKAVIDAAKAGVDAATARLKLEIDRLTPEDTGRLLSANRTKPATQRPNAVVGAVVNNTPYAQYVEYGLGRSFNYHKPRGVVAFRGIGARMFTRAFDGNKKELVKIVGDEITASLRAAFR